jgi:hypothetical protein
LSQDPQTLRLEYKTAQDSKKYQLMYQATKKCFIFILFSIKMLNFDIFKPQFFTELRFCSKINRTLVETDKKYRTSMKTITVQVYTNTISVCSTEIL